MNFLLDVDGCIVDNGKCFKEYVQSYLKKYNMPHEIVNPNGYYASDIFGVKVDINHVAVDDSFVDFYIAEPMRNACEVIKELKNMGHTIIILTSRKPELEIPVTQKMRDMFNIPHDDRFTNSAELTVLYLKYYDIPFDKVVFREDKDLYAAGIANAIAVDDMSYNLQAYLNMDIRCVAFDAPHNINCNTERITDWKELLELPGVRN